MQTNKTKNTMALSSKELSKELMEIAMDCDRIGDTFFFVHGKKGMIPDITVIGGDLVTLGATLSQLIEEGLKKDANEQAVQVTRMILNSVAFTCARNRLAGALLTGSLVANSISVEREEEHYDDDDMHRDCDS